MSQAIPEKYRDLFTKKAFASLATLMPDGRPQVTPVWCDVEGDLVIVTPPKGGRRTGICDVILEWHCPSRIRKTLIAIWSFAGAWLKSQSKALRRTSTRWPRNIWEWTSILTLNQVKCG